MPTTPECGPRSGLIMRRWLEGLETFAIDVILERRYGRRADVLRWILHGLAAIYRVLVKSGWQCIGIAISARARWAVWSLVWEISRSVELAKRRLSRCLPGHCKRAADAWRFSAGGTRVFRARCF